MSDSTPQIRVLLVDDQHLVRQALSELFRKADELLIVGVCESCQEAIAQAKALQPDIVVLDVLTEPSPFAGARDLARGFPAAKIVVLDDVSSDINAREALRMGAGGYLTKQQPFSQIALGLRQVMRGDRVFAPDIARRLIFSADGVRLAGSDGASAIAKLTPRETDVLIHLAQGLSVRQCAELLGIGVSTAGNHRSRLMRKLNVHKTVALVRLALREGLIPAAE